MSTTGAFIVTTARPSIGSNVDITWFLATSRGERQLHATGRVLRVESGRNQNALAGFAVRFASEVVLQPDTQN
jgi:hypothetical protein